jgi:ubiquinone/menaquinone biosynthesis C-methylase UbiE
MFNFDEFAKRYDKLRVADLGIINCFIDKIKLHKNSNILDFGCGTGNYLFMLKKLGYINLYGIDNSSNMLSYAKNKLEIDFYLGNHYNYPVFGTIFNFIYMIDVIHFIKDIELLFDRFNQSLKYQAEIAIVTQSHEQINKCFYKKYFPSVTSINTDRYHPIDKILSTSKQFGFHLKERINYKQDEPLLIDGNYLSRIKEKCFSTLELIPQEEFDLGIKMLEEELISKKFFMVNHWGRTILYLKKDRL